MVVVPAGEFLMGSPADESQRSSAEGPLHRVTIGSALGIGKYEVTFAEWDACVADGGCRHNPRDTGWGRGRRPVINVSWDDITSEYLPWLSAKTGQPYRLLTEAEWEYAARAGTTASFSTGATISTRQANFDGTSTYGGGVKGEYRQRTLEAGTFPANAFGLHDMHGNVWEWVADCYVDSYDNAPADGRGVAAVPSCARVLRGGSWIDAPRVLRSAYRGRVPAGARFIYRGFRVARTLG
jgi:formylglycine-generating enzyme required for sulfatase activity